MRRSNLFLLHPIPVVSIQLICQLIWTLFYVSTFSLSLPLSLSLSPSLFLTPFFCLPLLQSPPLSLSLILECVHAVSNLSRCLSGCSVYALCATLLPSPLSYALYCTALHCSSLLSSPSLLLLFLPSLSFSTCIPLSLHSRISVVHCCAPLHCLGKYCTLLVFLRQS